MSQIERADADGCEPPSGLAPGVFATVLRGSASESPTSVELGRRHRSAAGKVCCA